MTSRPFYQVNVVYREPVPMMSGKKCMKCERSFGIEIVLAQDLSKLYKSLSHFFDVVLIKSDN